jgi:hypothetical protein
MYKKNILKHMFDCDRYIVIVTFRFFVGPSMVLSVSFGVSNKVYFQSKNLVFNFFLRVSCAFDCIDMYFSHTVLSLSCSLFAQIFFLLGFIIMIYVVPFPPYPKWPSARLPFSHWWVQMLKPVFCLSSTTLL